MEVTAACDEKQGSDERLIDTPICHDLRKEMGWKLALWLF
jgi:hypothetical protein